MCNVQGRQEGKELAREKGTRRGASDTHKRGVDSVKRTRRRRGGIEGKEKMVVGWEVVGRSAKEKKN